MKFFEDVHLGEISELGGRAFGLAADVTEESDLERLRTLKRSDWKRKGVQDCVGSVSLADLTRKMAEHDRSHTEDIRSLFAEMRGEDPDRGDGPTSAVA